MQKVLQHTQLILISPEHKLKLSSRSVDQEIDFKWCNYALRKRV
jgi:hypothetical protein